MKVSWYLSRRIGGLPPRTHKIYLIVLLLIFIPIEAAEPVLVLILIVILILTQLSSAHAILSTIAYAHPRSFSALLVPRSRAHTWYLVLGTCYCWAPTHLYIVICEIFSRMYTTLGMLDVRTFVDRLTRDSNSSAASNLIGGAWNLARGSKCIPDVRNALERLVMCFAINYVF